LRQEPAHLLCKAGKRFDHVCIFRRDDGGVDNILCGPPLQKGDTLLCDRDCNVFLGLDGTCTEVRGRDDLVELEEWRVQGGFLLEDVEGCTSYLPGFQSLVKSFLIDYAPACAIDDPDSILHHGDRLFVHHVASFLDEGGMHRDDIGNSKEFLEGGRIDTHLGSPLPRDERVIPDDVHAHGLRPLGDFPPDPAKSHDAKCLFIQFDSHELRPLPLLLLQRGIGLRDVPGEGEHHRHGVLGCGKSISLGRIRHDDALLRGRFHVDIINTCPCTADEPEPPPSIDDPCGYIRAAPHDESIILPDYLHELILGEVGFDIDRALPAQNFQAFIGQGIADQYFKIRHKTLRTIAVIPIEYYYPRDARHEKNLSTRVICRVLESMLAGNENVLNWE